MKNLRFVFFLLLMLIINLSINLFASTIDHPPDKPGCETQCCFKVKQGNQLSIYYHCRLATVKFNFTITAYCWNGEYYQEYTCVNGFDLRYDVCCYFHNYRGTSGCPQSTEGEVELEFYGTLDAEYECWKNIHISSCNSYSKHYSKQIFPK